MARSTKKPFYTDQSKGSTKKVKRNANRAVRQTDDVSDGKQYRKVFCTYSIRDWSFHCPKDKKAYRK